MRADQKLLVGLFLAATAAANSQEIHDHGAPEKLGRVEFPVSCKPTVQSSFNRGVALLHSFAYADAEAEFKQVAERDPQCAMAHWGIAMTYFHQLWEPPIAADKVAIARKEIEEARQIGAKTEREQEFIGALSLIFQDDGSLKYPVRAAYYADAMRQLAKGNPEDPEAQIFYALALLATASPADKAHTHQKEAAAVLEPLFQRYPDHPGIPHYLIHAYDNAELASRGLKAAREYAKIAPSAPHALHMPSHIFTRLGLWEDSVSSNLAAREAARRQGDTGEELHSMDYLEYAYLQLGRDKEAASIVEQVKEMSNVNLAEFKIGYAATAIPIRYAVERRDWRAAAKITPPEGAAPQVTAIAVWARGLGLSRSGHAGEAAAETQRLRAIEAQLKQGGNGYWATQAGAMANEVQAWSAQAAGKKTEAVELLRAAADAEDALEKLPVTPGPVLPAREQLGDLLLEQGDAKGASAEFAVALKNAPGRRWGLQGAAKAAALERATNSKK